MTDEKHYSNAQIEREMRRMAKERLQARDADEARQRSVDEAAEREGRPAVYVSSDPRCPTGYERDNVVLTSYPPKYRFIRQDGEPAGDEGDDLNIDIDVDDEMDALDIDLDIDIDEAAEFAEEEIDAVLREMAVAELRRRRQFPNMPEYEFGPFPQPPGHPPVYPRFPNPPGIGPFPTPPNDGIFPNPPGGGPFPQYPHPGTGPRPAPMPEYPPAEPSWPPRQDEDWRFPLPGRLPDGSVPLGGVPGDRKPLSPLP